MKKLLFPLIIILLTLASCSGGNNNTQQQNDDSEEQLRRASIIAGDFVEQCLGVECDFDALSYQGEKTSVEDRYKVLQKFSCNYEGVESEYVYRIYLQYFGGEWEDINNWSYGSLEVESVRTGKTFTFHGNMKQRAEAANSPNRQESIDGVAFVITFDNGDIMEIASDDQLPRSVITKIAAKYPKYSSIIFHTSDRMARGDEYMTVMETLAIDMIDNKTYNVKTWEQL